MSNKNGMSVEILTLGCIVRALYVPGQYNPVDITPGYTDVSSKCQDNILIYEVFKHNP